MAELDANIEDGIVVQEDTNIGMDLHVQVTNLAVAVFIILRKDLNMAKIIQELRRNNGCYTVNVEASSQDRAEHLIDEKYSDCYHEPFISSIEKINPRVYEVKFKVCRPG